RITTESVAMAAGVGMLFRVGSSMTVWSGPTLWDAMPAWAIASHAPTYNAAEHGAAPRCPHMLGHARACGSGRVPSGAERADQVRPKWGHIRPAFSRAYPSRCHLPLARDEVRADTGRLRPLPRAGVCYPARGAALPGGRAGERRAAVYTRLGR